jgi:hypothetical protein
MVIASVHRKGNYEALVRYLQMARMKSREAAIETELVLTFAQTKGDFIPSPSSKTATAALTRRCTLMYLCSSSQLVSLSGSVLLLEQFKQTDQTSKERKDQHSA